MAYRVIIGIFGVLYIIGDALWIDAGNAVAILRNDDTSKWIPHYILETHVYQLHTCCNMCSIDHYILVLRPFPWSLAGVKINAASSQSGGDLDRNLMIIWVIVM